MINSKKKGKSGELEVMHLLKERGYNNVRRTAQYCGNNGEEDVGDLTGLDYMHIEVKRVQNLNLYNAYLQAKRDSKNNNRHLVFHRKNNQKWLVSMDFDTFIELYDSFYSDMKLKEMEKAND